MSARVSLASRYQARPDAQHEAAVAKTTQQLAKHRKGAQATVTVKSQHFMELPPLSPKKPKKRRVIKGRP